VPDSDGVALPAPDEGAPSSPSTRPAHAALVASGILLSRIFGLVRQRVLAHYLGLSDASDAFGAAFRIPNFLQNLLGEGVLSASFIPVYARLRAEKQDHDAERLANAVFGLLAVATSLIVLAGVALAGPLTDAIAPGFAGAKRDLTVRLVRILFPGAGLLVLSAWCLGVLNSHRRFLLSYAAPVVWNLAIILTVMLSPVRHDEAGAAVAAAVGSVIGSALQFVVQLPTVLGLLHRLRPTIDTAATHVRMVLRNFGPVFISRGVVQISAFVDTILASLLGRGAVAALMSAQVIYTLPVSLFGMAVSAAELPEMSSATGSEREVADVLRGRLDAGLRRIAFFVVPSAAAFLAFGGVIAGALFQTGRFGAEDSRYVWAILAGSAVGLLAATMGRLYSSAYYALRDPRTPLRYAVLRVVLTTGLGYLAAIPLPPALGLEPRWGAVGLTATAGLAGWVEFLLLRRGLSRRLGPTGSLTPYLARLWSAAAAAVLIGLGVQAAVPPLHPILQAGVVLTPFGLGYLLLTAVVRIPEAQALVRRLAPRR
jgi:putative peptidoglycan lipid II flippase